MCGASVRVLCVLAMHREHAWPVRLLKKSARVLVGESAHKPDTVSTHVALDSDRQPNNAPHISCTKTRPMTKEQKSGKRE